MDDLLYYNNVIICQIHTIFANFAYTFTLAVGGGGLNRCEGAVEFTGDNSFVASFWHQGSWGRLGKFS